MMQRIWVAMAVLTAALACTPPKPVAYLQAAENEARQDDVRRALGPPSVMKPLPDGGSEWIYRSWDHEPGSRVSAPAAWCDEYRLVFDTQGVLRSWDVHSARHIGETMPAACRRPMAANREP